MDELLNKVIAPSELVTEFTKDNIKFKFPEVLVPYGRLGKNELPYIVDHRNSRHLKLYRYPRYYKVCGTFSSIQDKERMKQSFRSDRIIMEKLLYYMKLLFNSIRPCLFDLTEVFGDQEVYRCDNNGPRVYVKWYYNPRSHKPSDNEIFITIF